jgi:hypothetical protein
MVPNDQNKNVLLSSSKDIRELVNNNGNKILNDTRIIGGVAGLEPDNRDQPWFPAEKVKKKRVVTEHKSWQYVGQDLSGEFQYKLLENVSAHGVQGIVDGSFNVSFMIRQISDKISGYKAQDLEKGWHEPSKFVDLSWVLLAISRSEGKCYYCREPVVFIYEMARDPKQWTLERIKNTMGHNKDNVEIACLGCNLRRRTMYHERFLFTKQLTITKHNK